MNNKKILYSRSKQKGLDYKYERIEYPKNKNEKKFRKKEKDLDTEDMLKLSDYPTINDELKRNYEAESKQ